MYFKIKLSYNNEYLSIDEKELETALFAFITDGKAIFKNGVVKGSSILSISEDWHKEMGWNDGYKLQDLDYAELNRKGITAKYTGVIGKAREKVQYFISTNQTHLIGKNIDISELNTEIKSQAIDTSELANKFKIN